MDRWRDMGTPGWGYADVLPSFKKSEAAPHRDSQLHGQSGPLKISLAGNYCAVSQMFVEAAQQAGATGVAQQGGSFHVQLAMNLRNSIDSANC